MTENLEPLILILFVSSALTLLLTYFKIPITTYQQIIIFLLLIALIGYNHFLRKDKHLPIQLETKITLFVSSLFVQLLVVSSGGVFSPFLILIHLFALATSFLVNMKSSVSFIILVLAVLAANSWLNPEQLQLIKNDPGTVALLSASLAVIIPLSQLISGKYHLKEEITKLLTKQVQVGGSILESLSELVLVTDKNLQIILTNDALEKNLNLSRADVLGKPLLDVLMLQDQAGQKANYTSLSLDKVLVDKSTRIISGFLLYTQNRTPPYQVTIQIRPIVDASDNVDQLSFVITEERSSGKHTDLEKAQTVLESRLNNLRSQLHSANFTRLETLLELIIKTEKDVLIANELEDHQIKQQAKLTDVAAVSKELVEKKQNLAQNLKVNLKFVLQPEDVNELSLFSLQKSNANLSKSLVSDFMVALDVNWVAVCIDKVLDLAVLLSSDTPTPWVELIPTHSGNSVSINILASSPNLKEGEKSLLFSQYFGTLAEKTNLKFGSGLEGFIAKALSTQLDIPIKVELSSDPSQILFNITIPRSPRS